VTCEKTAGAVSADGEVRVPFAQTALGEPEWEELGYTRLFSERVRICVISKELVNTLDAKSEERVLKE
jgi:hypothetical protein